MQFTRLGLRASLRAAAARARPPHGAGPASREGALAVAGEGGFNRGPDSVSDSDSDSDSASASVTVG